MLNSNWSTNYKTLARKTQFRECLTAERPLFHVIVDVRSRLFRYMRLQVPNRRLHDKIKCVFGLLTDQHKEEAKVIEDAFSTMRKEVAMLLAENTTYVLCSPTNCPFKTGIKEAHKETAIRKQGNLVKAISSFRNDMFNVDKLLECHVAFESYLIANADEICALSTLKIQTAPHRLRTVAPEKDDLFESDRLCAKKAGDNSQASAVLSEDFDCVALFGAEMMVKEVYPMFFTYTILEDVMSTFCSTSKTNLIHKCCILGTDYNKGIKGVGPVAIEKIDEDGARAHFETCMALQSTNKDELMKFFL